MFGTIFVAEEFTTVPDDFRPNKAQDALDAAGIEYIRSVYEEKMPFASDEES